MLMFIKIAGTEEAAGAGEGFSKSLTYSISLKRHSAPHCRPLERTCRGADLGGYAKCLPIFPRRTFFIFYFCCRCCSTFIQPLQNLHGLFQTGVPLYPHQARDKPQPF